MDTATSSTVEIPSGKDTSYENFPVGSWLLPARLRPHIAVFYRFARAIDDIADSNELSAEEKLSRLEGFDDALLGHRPDDAAYATAHAMRRSLSETGTTPQHCLDLIEAFKRDATKLRYGGWDDLIGYCLLSAAPVGRYLLDLHGENSDGYRFSDALCNALQVINHLQDCKDDYLTLDRVYLPAPWFDEFGVGIETLEGSACPPGLRRLLDRTLDQVESLMPAARDLPGALTNRRLAMESAAIVRIADTLIRRLRTDDPLADRIELSKYQYISCCVRGAVSANF